MSGFQDTGPATRAQSMTPNDTDDIEAGDMPRAIWVGGAGNLAVVMADGQTVTFEAVPAGFMLPIRIKRLLTSTTASAIVGLW